jgi:1-acyl-sn-glycerol-3-phosphate acyltransferase
MKAYLLLALVISQLLWWDILDKVLIAYRWSRARSFIDRTISWRGRRLFAIARFAVGLDLTIDIDQDRLPDQMIIVANHQSVIDIIALLAGFPNHSLRFVAKRELGRGFPAVSRVLRVQRHALIPRDGDFGRAMTEIERLGRHLTGSVSPVIFPEGTRSRDGEVHRFHSGAVRRLHRAKTLPIVAVAVDGGWRFSTMTELSRVPPGHRYRVQLIDVYPPVTEKSSMIQQISDAERGIADTITRWRSETIC